MPTYIVRVEADELLDSADADAIERAISYVGLLSGAPQSEARFSATIDREPVDETDVVQLPCGHQQTSTGRVEPGDTIDCHYNLCDRVRVGAVERIAAIQIVHAQED